MCAVAVVRGARHGAQEHAGLKVDAVAVVGEAGVAADGVVALVLNVVAVCVDAAVLVAIVVIRRPGVQLQLKPRC